MHKFYTQCVFFLLIYTAHNQTFFSKISPTHNQCPVISYLISWIGVHVWSTLDLFSPLLVFLHSCSFTWSWEKLRDQKLAVCRNLKSFCMTNLVCLLIWYFILLNSSLLSLGVSHIACKYCSHIRCPPNCVSQVAVE